MLEIRESCAWDMKELCTDKTLGTSGDPYWVKLSKKKKYDKSEFVKITLRLNHVYGENSL